MRNKVIAIFVICFLIYHTTHAQYLSIADTSKVDIFTATNPDSLDFDKDGAVDIIITNKSIVSCTYPSSCISNWKDITPMTNFSVYMSGVTKCFNISDTIFSNGPDWTSNTSFLNGVMCHMGCESSPQGCWAWAPGYHYIGIRKIINNDTILGWIYTDLSPTSTELYAFEKGHLLSVKDIYNDDSFKIYPTLVDNSLNIESGNNTRCYYELYNIYGQILLQNKLISFPSTVNLDNLKSGVYFIRVFNSKTQITKKIFKI